ncbi:hypothetical protein BHE74_00022032 [Ensete ventricosum]|nr:hypothetical protein BHE74_00022032 [Ensete ventricosum]
MRVRRTTSSPPWIITTTRSSTIYRLRVLCRTRKSINRGDQLQIRIGFPWRGKGNP